MVYPGICLCFSGGTLVSTSEWVKRIEDLNPSDKVKTLTKDGLEKWTRFYTWGHRETQRVEEFVVLYVESCGKELIISSEHLLFIAAGGVNRRMTKKAGEVCVGETIEKMRNLYLKFQNWD